MGTATAVPAAAWTMPAGEPRLVLSSNATVRRATAARLTFLSVGLPAGSWFSIGVKDNPICALYMGDSGVVDYRAVATGSMTAKQVKVVLIQKDATFTTRFGASGALVLIPCSIFQQRMRESPSRRLSQAIVLPLLNMGGDTDGLAAKLIGDCLFRVAQYLDQEIPGRRLEKAAELLLSLLLETLPDSPEERASTESAVPWYVPAVENFIAEHATDPITMKDLAAAAGVSPRTLHDGFRKHRGYSPMRYLREQRMIALRKELQQPETITTVTDAALKWRFNHLGRFAIYYAQRFGELPSETLRAARGAG